MKVFGKLKNFLVLLKIIKKPSNKKTRLYVSLEKRDHFSHNRFSSVGEKIKSTVWKNLAPISFKKSQDKQTLIKNIEQWIKTSPDAEKTERQAAKKIILYAYSKKNKEDYETDGGWSRNVINLSNFSTLSSLPSGMKNKNLNLRGCTNLRNIPDDLAPQPGFYLDIEGCINIKNLNKKITRGLDTAKNCFIIYASGSGIDLNSLGFQPIEKLKSGNQYGYLFHKNTVLTNKPFAHTGGYSRHLDNNYYSSIVYPKTKKTETYNSFDPEAEVQAGNLNMYWNT